MQELSSDLMQFFLVKNNMLTSVHNDADAADDADATYDHNRVIGIELLKAFSCAKSKWSVCCWRERLMVRRAGKDQARCTFSQ